ncbi:E3 ubiquitin-protein ligase rad18 [Apiotrichum porosum]|uniref:E3 ubiquitin-protein ligase rad18 n=1 Tax=Apiotrichum porosum TaxID=105984 RepID=A0A427Y087_9TREE|nr:E3 ubiquitin-protein ligase rad18 [Apiotrichum porosum]RSH84519.1 E3 ubiquitin-protein ligase rad18 [Apiotrichum porosum]
MDLSHPLLQAGDTEPVPFPESFPQLRRLDRAVVCPICKELFQGPLTRRQCIRSFLDVSKKCPSCHEPAKEASIRRNRALEEMTDAWEAARASLLELAQPPRKRSRDSGVASSSKRTRNASPRKASPEEPDSDIEVLEDDSTDVPAELAENDEAPCPLCAATMPISAIPTHIDRGCPPPKPKAGPLSVGNQKADWKKVFSGAASGKAKVADMKRIVKPNYSLTALGELRALLTEHGLPTTGDRTALENRFQEWIVLFNANLDTSHPSSLPVLRTKLASMEASRKRDKDKGKDDEVDALQSKEGLKRHATDQKSEFERLRQQILNRKNKQSGSAADTAIEVE